MDFLNLQHLLITAPVVLFSLSLHEFFHGWMADRLGDPTARYAGRLTLNPIAHYDLVGTTMALLFGFGWAKPVPVNPVMLRWPKRDMMFTAFAGPMTNFVLAIAFAVALSLLMRWPDPPHAVEPLRMMAVWGVFLNVGLAVFNLLPLFPLDGHHILRGLLSNEAALAYDRVGHYSSFILMAIVIFGGPWMTAIIVRVSMAILTAAHLPVPLD